VQGRFDGSRSDGDGASNGDEGRAEREDGASDRGGRAVSTEDLACRAVPLGPIVCVPVRGDVQPEDRDEHPERHEGAGAEAAGAGLGRHWREG
jgi:hypothetical protein